MKGVRILDPNARPPPFSRVVEAKARGIADRLHQDRELDPTLDVLARDIALALSQIEGVRHVHDKARSSILHQELELDTEIMQREPREPVYVDPRLPERDRLRDRLRALGKERRKLLLREEEQIRPFHERLLLLTNRYHQLRGKHGH